MAAPSEYRHSAFPRKEFFVTTRWSMVLDAGKAGAPEAADALETLCRLYYQPLYAYVRRRGYAPADAQDLTQEFFARLVQRHGLATVSPDKGRFRSFLLASMNHFLANEWDRAKAEKRGGKVNFISLDEDSAESRFANEDLADLSAERLFDQRWAITLLHESMLRLQAETAAADKTALFELLKPFLENEPQPGDYARVAAELGWTTGAVAVAVHRLRSRYRELVTEEVARTVADPRDAEDELRRLFAALQ
jgi:RNA polymerase sigma-70 factor (ECF subfamily)